MQGRLLIERYIIREFAVRLAWLGGLLVALFSVQRLGLYLTHAAEGNIPPSLVLSVWLLKIPHRLPEVLAFSTFLALLLTYARLLHDRELTVLRGGGWGLRQHLGLAAKIALAAALAAGLLSFVLAPRANLGAERLLATAPETLTLPLPGRFHTLSRGHGTILVERGEALLAERAYLYLDEPGGHTVITARDVELRAAADGRPRELELRGGRRYDAATGRAPHRVTSFDRYQAVLPTVGGVPGDTGRPRALPLQRLWERGTARDWAELQFRADQVMLCLLLPLLAVLLHPVLPGRQLRYTSLVVGVAGFFGYRSLLEVGRSMLAREQVPPILGTWWVHLLLVGVLALLLYRHVRPLPRGAL